MKIVSSKKNPLYTRLSASPYFIAILAAIILITPLLIKGSLTLAGKEPYLLNRLSSQFLEKGVEPIDNLSYAGRAYVYPLGSVILTAILKKYTSTNFALIILPIILGAIASMLFYAIIYMKFNDRKIAAISTIILALSPSFIFSFSAMKEFTIPLFLTLLSYYLLLKNKYKFLAYSLLVLTIFFGIEHFIISLIILWLFYNRNKKHRTIIPAILIIAAFLAIYLPIIIHYGLPEKAQFEQYNPLFNIFSDLGSMFGISLFIVFLSFFGLKELWKEKYTYLKLYLIIILLLILLIIEPEFVIYTTLILAPLAALGITYLMKARWESLIIKDLTILILLLGLLFSTVSFANSYKSSHPTAAEIASLNFLRQYSNKDSVILSHISQGTWINSIALRKNVMDEQLLYAPQLNQRYQDSQEIFNSRNLEKTKELLNKYSITHIYLTPEMRQGLVWQSEEQGLLFVLKFSKDSFKQIYNEEGIEIWEVSR